MATKTFLNPDEVIMEATLPSDRIQFLTKKGKLPQTVEEFVMKIQDLHRRIGMNLSPEQKAYAEMVLNDAMEEQNGDKVSLSNQSYLKMVEPELLEAGVFGAIAKGYAETIRSWDKKTSMNVVKTPDDPEIRNPQEAADAMVDLLFEMTYDRGKYL